MINLQINCVCISQICELHTAEPKSSNPFTLLRLSPYMFKVIQTARMLSTFGLIPLPHFSVLVELFYNTHHLGFIIYFISACSYFSYKI